MISKFQKFIEKGGLFSDRDSILVACSGGIDSMVLVDLLIANKNKIAIAHINHQTRGDESDEDARFVEDFARKNNIEYHGISSPLAATSQSSGENFHAHARAFRYQYLESIRSQCNYDLIATAHHNTDSIETFFINLLRGTGLNGLLGIPVVNNKIIRPLMFANRNSIEDYAEKYKIKYREDSSNDSIKYRRNNIRKNLLPTIDKIESSARDRISDSIANLKSSKALLDELIANSKIIVHEGNSYTIEIDKLKIYQNQAQLLFQMLRVFGFNYSQCSRIATSLHNTGSLFNSQSHQLLVDRNHLLIKTIDKQNLNNTLIEGPGEYHLADTKIVVSIVNELSNKMENEEYLDYEKLSFPLELRTWEHGDYFYPLGMNGKSQKISDFLINNKVSRFDKEKVLVLLNEDQIAAVLKWRIDERYKYSSATKRFLKLAWS